MATKQMPQGATSSKPWVAVFCDIGLTPQGPLDVRARLSSVMKAKRVLGPSRYSPVTLAPPPPTLSKGVGGGLDLNEIGALDVPSGVVDMTLLEEPPRVRFNGCAIPKAACGPGPIPSSSEVTPFAASLTGCMRPGMRAPVGSAQPLCEQCRLMSPRASHRAPESQCAGLRGVGAQMQADMLVSNRD